MKIALLQTAPTLGGVDANLHQLDALVSRADDEGADLCVAPELATSGYFLTPGEVPHIRSDDERLVQLGS